MKILTPLITAALSLLLANATASGQSIDDFQTHQTGNWNTVSTWERWDGSTWVTPAPSTPTNSNGLITILNGHTVTVTANVTVDQVVLNAGGQITLNNGDTLTVANGTGTDLSVSGTFNNAGNIIRNAGATIAFNSGSSYQHSQDAGTIPTATWNAASTCLVTGTVATLPNGLNQTFGHLTWNCSGQTTTATLANTLTINGNLTIQSTGGAGQFRLASGTNTIGGGCTQSGGTVRLAGASNRTVTVSGNFGMTSGTIEMADNTGIGILNVAGNFSQTGGSITESGTSTTSGIVFNGAGTQTYTSGGTITNTINFTVNSGSTLQVNNGSTLQVNNTAAMTTGTSIINGPGNFTLSSGATLNIGSPNGITASAASGNIQVTGTRTYSTGANYTYNGASAQNTGDGLPATVNNLTINNSSGVTLGSNVSVSGNLSVSAGIFDISTFTLNRASTGGILTVSNGATLKIGGTNSFPSNYSTHTLGSTSTVEYGGTTQTVTIESYGQLTFSNSGTKTFAAGTSNIAGTFTISGTATADAATNATTINYNGSVAQTVRALNYNSLTISGARTTNSVTLASSGTIGVAGTFTASATFTSGGYVITGSTIDFNNSGAQTITAFNYNTLTLSNAGAKTLPGSALSIAGNFSTSGTAA